ncbi:MAG: radical SAM protein [Verrucomicrobiota bacterium]
MMALDSFNSLKAWPLDGLSEFMLRCKMRGVREVNLTGTNTDPSLFQRQRELLSILHDQEFRVGIRTNGAVRDIPYYDYASLSVTSLDPDLYRKTMGQGSPPNIEWWLERYGLGLKINIVLCPETVPDDLYATITRLARMGIGRINLREPYGQPHIGDPFSDMKADGSVKGMPVYVIDGCGVCYWDVHYCEVESVNLYASGRVSETYPITKGHADDGIVRGQEHFLKAGRVRKQWLTPDGERQA